MFVITLASFLLLLLSYYFYYCFINRDYYSKTAGIPSPKRYPIIGHCYLFIGKPENSFKLMAKLSVEFKRLIAIWLGPWLNICIFTAQDAEIVLKESRNMDKSYHYKFLKPWLGDSILISNGQKFQQNKKIVTQAFHLQHLKEYLRIFNRQADHLLEDLQQYVDKDQFDIYNVINHYTMHTLLETTLGVDSCTMSPKDVLDYAKAVEDVGCYGFMRMQRPWLYADWCFHFSQLKKDQDRALSVLNKFTNLVINKRREEYENRRKSINYDGDKAKKKFLDTFFEMDERNGHKFTGEEIKDEVMTIMFAGQDTTTTTIAFVLSSLGYYKQIQDRVIDELTTILNNSNGDDDITYDDLQNMKYLEQVIQETWRLFPPIPAISKKLHQDLQLDDLIMPKGCTVIISIMSIHRNPTEYPDPHEFNPDNFLPERMKHRHPYSFLPFSANYRQCIGGKYAMMIIKIFLAKILLKYEINNAKPLNKYKLSAQTVLKRKDGHFVDIAERQLS